MGVSFPQRIMIPIDFVYRVVGNLQPWERKAKSSSSSSSFSGFSPNMPVPLSQLASASGVISTLASLTPVCLVMYTVAGPAVSAVLSPSAATVFEQLQKHESDGSCRTGIDVGEFPGLVGFWEIYAFNGKVFCCATTACHPSCQSRIIVDVGSSSCGGDVSFIKGVFPAF